jgi:Na+-transporting NADH:ubiquinone oxidoreductase subunit A
METIRIKGGQRFRIKHAPLSDRDQLDAPETVGVTPRGIRGLKPKVVVKEGEAVKRGSVLFHDKKRPDVKWTSPAGGTIKELRWGPRRKLEAIVVERAKEDEAEDFGKTDRGALAGLGAETVVERLVKSGLWSRFIAFPGWAVAPIPGETIPETHSEHDEPPPPPKTIRAIYVSAISTEPHQVDPIVALEGNEELFAAGLEAVKQVAKKTWLISGDDKKLPANAASVTGVVHRIVQAKYPAENAGVQVYYTEPLGPEEVAVGLNVEDVIDIGHLFLHGTLRAERTYALAGDGARAKKHFKGYAGMRVLDIVGKDDEALGDTRVIAGGIFTGDKVSTDDFLAAGERCVQVMKEDRYRTPFHFQTRLGAKYLTLFKTWIAGWTAPGTGEATTSTHGEERACIQCGKCIEVCPVGLMPNLVLKAAVASDIEKMESVFIHDCVDCGLCTFACPSKIELGEHIEAGKALIEKEG